MNRTSTPDIQAESVLRRRRDLGLLTSTLVPTLRVVTHARTLCVANQKPRKSEIIRDCPAKFVQYLRKTYRPEMNPMANDDLQQAVASIREMVLAHDATGVSDSLLLKLFVSEHDEAAFEALVRAAKQKNPLLRAYTLLGMAPGESSRLLSGVRSNSQNGDA